jgi:GT2 family glycosyltransferase
VVQLPFWTALAERLRRMFGWQIVYDCMDDHSGFSTNDDTMLRAEDRTIAAADLVAATSDLLYEKVERKARRTILVRNACDYEHFAGAADPLALVEAAKSQVTVGFYGAIAEWFDADLVADLAEQRPGWKFKLIGGTHTGDVTRLKKLHNVALFGERPYADLPRLTASWDCYIIPFKRTVLTEATNPVKVYEMLATGKPIVAVDLPELRSMAHEGLLSLADDAAGFVLAIERALAENSDFECFRRRAFAARNTWQERFGVLDRAVRELFPLASVVVVTHNNLRLNRACLQSIFRHTAHPNYEVIAVDNGSRDGTAEWLADEATREPRLKVIRNAENRGFSAANNQGLRAARGRFLCLLNNDTVVGQGWLDTLIDHLRRKPELGLVGPVSNEVGNEAKVPIGYRDVADMPRWADDYCRRHDGETVPIEMLAFFCVAMTRAVYEQIGELDERFGLGYFEDDDYCHRVRAQGYELRFARDAFVHHWQGATFGLFGENSLLRIHGENRKKFEAKWNTSWDAGSMADAH